MKKLIYTLAFVLIVHCTLEINNCSAQWVQMANEMGTNTMAFRLVSNGTDIFAGTIGTGVWRSTNNGENWTAVNNGIPIFVVGNLRGLTVCGTNIFAGFTDYGGIYRSTNNGGSWVAVNNGLPDLRIMCLTSDGTNIFAGGSWSGVFLSTNNGASWNSVSNGLPSATINSIIIISGTNIFVGTYMNGVYRSTNNGGYWTYAGSGLPNQIINCLASSSTNIFAGTDTAGFGGVYISTNNGGSWTQTSLNNANIYGLTVSGANLFAATGANLTAGRWNSATGGVFLSTNNGVTWLDKSQGLNINNLLVAPILVANNYIFAGTSQSVWRRTLAEIIGIQNNSSEIPSSFSLSQNYPNPFNPVTKIKFDIPKLSITELKIYDNLGREIYTLVSEGMIAGKYEIEWNASNYPSGVYFYKLIAGDYVETRKMILLK
jgi:hypothetical protein